MVSLFSHGNNVQRDIQAKKQDILEHYLWKCPVLTKLQAECLQSYYKQKQPSRGVFLERCAHLNNHYHQIYLIM